MNKTTFALFFGNRGFFPASLIASAREEMKRELNALGHEVLMLDTEATRNGAIETPKEGEVYASFLRSNPGKFGGVIVCLPNFGDETDAVAALQSGMDIGMSRDMFDSFMKYQKAMQKTFRQMQSIYGFTIVDGMRSADAINADLRKKIGAVLAGRL